MTERLPLLVPDALTDAQLELYQSIVGSSRSSFMTLTDAEGRLHGPFNAFLYSPILGDILQRLGAAIRQSTHLSRRAQELAILVTAVHCESPYEARAHEALALGVGWRPEQVELLLAGLEPEIEDPLEHAVWRTTRKLLEAGDLEDDAYEEALRVLGPEGVFDLTTLIGHYRLVALQLKLFRVPVGS
jgi:4-carboxymuconolactone decarboxylase